MKSSAIRISLAVLCLALAVGNAAAQTTDRIRLDKNRISLSEIFREIERQTNSVVIFNTDRTEVDKTVNIARTEGSVGEILTQAFSGTAYTYQINGRYIVVVRNAEKQTTQTPPRQLVQTEFENEVSDYTRLNLAPANNDVPSVRFDTIRTTRPHDGIFTYPSRSVEPKSTSRSVRSPLGQDKPQLLAVKTNLLWAATLTPNLTGEIGLGKKTSLEFGGGINRWNLRGSYDNNRKLAHWTLRAEFRYWLCERFEGHFFGAHAFYGQYNIGGSNVPMLFDKKYRYEGDAVGAGISYGYHWAWSKRWGMEFNAGFGVAVFDYVKKECEKCGSELGHYKKTYFGPTSLAVKIVFMIK